MHGSEEALSWVEKKAKVYDCVIVGGDLCTFHDTVYMEKFLTMVGRTAKKVFFVPGNNDPPDAAIPEGVLNIHGRQERLDKISIGGIGGSNITPFNTRFEITDDKARQILSSLGRVEILVSHCPPFGTKCDLYSGKHLGSVPVREYVEMNKPSIVLTGHVHEARGVDKIGSTTIVNPGPMLYGNYAEVETGAVYIVELKKAEV